MCPSPRLLLASALASLLCACASGAPADGPAATVRLLPARSPGAQGTLDLVQVGAVLRIVGAVHGLRANARYLLRVEDGGACAPPDALAGVPAGATAVAAAGPRPERPAPAAGDSLPDLHADATGAATFGLDVRTLSIGGPADVLGKAVVVRPRPGDPPADAAPAGWLACGIVRPR
ncbi:MAG: hypothetical protein PGN26_07735 [Xylophilus ampelinus]